VQNPKASTEEESIIPLVRLQASDPLSQVSGWKEDSTEPVRKREREREREREKENARFTVTTQFVLTPFYSSTQSLPPLSLALLFPISISHYVSRHGDALLETPSTSALGFRINCVSTTRTPPALSLYTGCFQKD